jgi:hypothetical protein
MTSPDTAPLLAAIEPMAAYCARTPAPNAHADRLAALVNAAADYVEAVEASRVGPDWAAVADCLLARCPLPVSANPSPWSAFAAAQLARPDFQLRRAQPLARRMALASLTSHHLGLPDSL